MAIRGTNGADQFFGTRFNDEIFGYEGNDVFFGSKGLDRLDGGADVDTVDYNVISGYEVGGEVDIDLQRTVQFGGFAEGDVLISIENVRGTIGDDTIRGNSVANMLVGNGGDDHLEGRGGDDRLFGDNTGSGGGVDGNDLLDGGTGNDELFGDGGNDTLIGGSGVNALDGGAGTDTASYAGYATGVLVSITGTASNGVALALGSTDGDSLKSIENIIGSNFADSISGSQVANVLDGGGGDDLMSGGGGADTLIGGSGIDTATYAGSAAGVTVELGVVLTINNTVLTINGTGAGGDAAGDTLNGIENLTGSNFDDGLTGNAFANRLDGGAGNDVLIGGGGNDLLIGGTGSNTMDGGTGIDTVSYASASGGVNVTLQTGVAEGNGHQDRLAGIENIIGSSFADKLAGSSAANVIDGGAGDDVMVGFGGADTLIGGAGIDSVFYNASSVGVTVTLGGTGTGGDAEGDTLTGIENIRGSRFDDTLIGDGGANVLNGDAGNDTIDGGGGNDLIIGGSGSDALNGGTGLDTVSYSESDAGVVVSLAAGTATDAGNTFSDILADIENLTGSGSGDQLTGSSSDNVIDGSGGNDVIAGLAGADVLIGGAGIDTATYAASTAAVSVTLGGLATGGDAQGDILSEIENLVGSSLADTLTGDGAANRIDGGSGDDVIDGGAGNDIIVGGASIGPEALTGGLGLDTFLYLSRSDSLAVGSSPSDFILDFQVGQDKLDFSALGINAGNILIQNQTSGGINSSIVTEDLNGNGQADNGEFALAIVIDGASFVTLQDMLL